MMSRSSWLGGGIPFPLLLLPLFWIALLLSPNLDQWNALWVLSIVHVLLYSSVNIYANYYDPRKRDRHYQMRGRRFPKWWLVVAVLLHASAVVLGGVYVNKTFMILVLLYGAIAFWFGVSRGGTSTSFLVWAFVRVAQGAGGTLIYYLGFNNYAITEVAPKVWLTGLVAVLLLAALYPAKIASSDKRIFLALLNVLLLAIAGALTWWLSETLAPSKYTVGLIAFFLAAVAFVFTNYSEDADSKKIIPWRHWAGTIAANAYAFYLFTDYSQVLQLVQ